MSGTDSTWWQVERLKEWMDMFNIREEEMRIHITPEYHRYEDPLTEEELPESERYWEIGVHARVEKYFDLPETSLTFDGSMDLGDMDEEEFFDVAYQQAVNSFEEEFDDAELLYYERD